MSINISDGRPPQDGQFQNLKSVGTFVASKITAAEVNANVIISGDVVATGGTIQNLSVDNLTLLNTESLVPFPGYVLLPLAVGVCGGVAAYVATTAPVINLTALNTDKVTWEVFVPGASSSRQLSIFIPLKAAIGSNVLKVTVNGTDYLATSSTLKSQSSFIYSCVPFAWTQSGMMTVVISQSAGTPPIAIGDSPFVALVSV